MSLTHQTGSRNLPKEQPIRQTNQPTKANTAEIPPPRMVRLTVSLPGNSSIACAMLSIGVLG